MSNETIFSNARIVLGEEILAGTVVVRDGLIAGIDAGPAEAGENLDGDFLIPGLVELHTDQLEGHYSPRPKVRWNPIAAVLAHDGQIAASGITTVFDALRIGIIDDGDINADDIRYLGDAIEDGVRSDRLRADHFIHLRCEVSADNCLECFSRFESDRRVRLASLMDHSPGQRQFANIDAYKMYYMGKLKMTRKVFDRYCEKRLADSLRNSASNRGAVTVACRERGIILASHDDATEEHVEEAVAQGVRIAEFPTTAIAAQKSRDAGLSVLMGAPNAVRGGSHSGNVSARALAEAGVLDILSSDYIPFSLIQSAFFLSEVVEDVSLPQAVAMVSKNPARAAGLDDRGEIAPGKRADLVRVRIDEHVPVVRSVWREGRRVA